MSGVVTGNTIWPEILKLPIREVRMANNKMVECQTCGKPIAKSAKVCPHCGAKKSQFLENLLFIVVATIVMVFLATVTYKDPASTVKRKKAESTPVEQTTQKSSSKKEESAKEKESVEDEESAEEAPAYDGPTTLAIGETAEFNDVKLKVMSAGFSEDYATIKPEDGKRFLGVILWVDNSSQETVRIGNIEKRFEAHCDGELVRPDAQGNKCEDWDGYDRVDKAAAPGKILAGVICYQVPEDFNEFVLSISPDFWNNVKLDFEFTREQIL